MAKRKTVARKKPAPTPKVVEEKKRASLDEIISAVPLESVTGAPSEDSPIDVREGVEWARDVYWAAQHIDEAMTKAKAGSSLRFALWKAARADPLKFVDQIMPKAMTVLERVRDKSGDSGLMEQAEKKSIAEIEKIIKAAVHEVSGRKENDSVVSLGIG